MSFSVIDMEEGCRYFFEHNDGIEVDITVKTQQGILFVQIEEIQPPYKRQATEILEKLMWNAEDEKVKIVIAYLHNMVGMEMMEAEEWLQTLGFEWLDDQWVYALGKVFDYPSPSSSPLFVSQEEKKKA